MKNYPSYDTAAVRRNVQQCDTNIQTYEGIIQQEIVKKRELTELLAQCEERDKYLASQAKEQ